MDRHFMLPLTLAAALHAGLLFGIRGSPAVPSQAKATTPPRDDRSAPIQVIPVAVPEPEDTAPAVGAPVKPAPSAPEPPAQDNPPGFTIEIPERTPILLPEMRTIPNGPIGVLEGMSGAKGSELGTILRSDQLDAAPRTRLQAPPAYPFEAKRDGRGGEVLVEFVVDEEGAVREPRVVRSNDRIFEEPTLRAVSRWRFEPGMRGGRIVRFRVSVPVVFNLSEN